MLIPALVALTPLKWQPVAPGVWRARIGAKEKVTLLSAAQCRARVFPAPGTSLHARKDLETATPPARETPAPYRGSAAELVYGRAVARIPLAPGEKLFGFGLQMTGGDRRGGVYHLRVDHYSRGQDRLHAPTPFYVSSAGYAVFFDTARPIDIYAGVGNRLGDPNNPRPRDRNTDPKWDPQPPGDAVEASVQAPGLDVYLFAGPTPMDAVRRYNLFCGGGPLPPRWALGFWHRVPMKFSAEQVKAEVAEFDRRGFPIDVVGLEPGWQETSYPGTFTWSKKRFPDPAGFVKAMAADGVRVNLWENPYVAPGSALYRRLKGNFGSHTVWLGAVPDLNVPAAAAIIRAHHKKVGVDIGVSGYKIDEVDGYDFWLWPDHARFPSGLPGDMMRQIYGVLWQREILRTFREDGRRAGVASPAGPAGDATPALPSHDSHRPANPTTHRPARRTFGLVRGSNGGATRFPFAIYSDSYDHREYVAGMVNAALAGVLWCAEARDAKSGEEWVRRMQTAAVSHVAQLNAWSSGTKPWSFPGYEEAVKKAMLLRVSLLPYIYTAYAEHHFEGTPVIRPMCLVDGGLEADQFMLGDDLLVAPMFAGTKSRTVRLPAARWFDLETGEAVGSVAFTGRSRIIEITPPLDKIPIFVRDGAVIPTLPVNGAVLRAGFPWKESDLLLRRFGTAKRHGRLYLDDGETFAYEREEYRWKELR